MGADCGADGHGVLLAAGDAGLIELLDEALAVVRLIGVQRQHREAGIDLMLLGELDGGGADAVQAHALAGPCLPP